jgi:hypothetical protein
MLEGKPKNNTIYQKLTCRGFSLEDQSYMRSRAFQAEQILQVVTPGEVYEIAVLFQKKTARRLEAKGLLEEKTREALEILKTDLSDLFEFKE